jgi:uncharacterized membrane protein YdfJ with MMPL/SSD domain
MPALTRFVLRHKALVALFWVAVAAAGVMTISGTTHPRRRRTPEADHPQNQGKSPDR